MAHKKYYIAKLEELGITRYAMKSIYDMDKSELQTVYARSSEKETHYRK